MRYLVLLFGLPLLLFQPCAFSETLTVAPPPAEEAIRAESAWIAMDTLNCRKDDSADAMACLAGLKWAPQNFPVEIEPATEEGYGDWLVRFPSPLPSGDPINDRVSMEWYQARNADGEVIHAPAFVVVHESGRGMVAGRAFARGLQKNGYHTFLIHLPGYGARTCALSWDVKRILPGFRQAIGDVRRARDAVSVLPFVDNKNIALHGTSLGGFVVATVTGMDHGYQKTFIMLAGGRLSDVLTQGSKDAAALRQKLLAAGVDDAEMKRLFQQIEPMRLAHRVNAASTFLFSGKFDEVVPPACSDAYAKAANLGSNHLVLPVGHYTAAVMFPMMLTKVNELMRAPLGR